MKIKRLLTLIEENLPKLTAMQGDRIGLQIQSGREEVQNILISMELNQDVVNEAITNGNDSIITFHPLIFNPLVSITNDNRVGDLVDRIITSRISLISIHTNFDAYSQGTSAILADLLGLSASGFLVPSEYDGNFGMGTVCLIEEGINSETLLNKVQSVCHSPIRYCEGPKDKLLKKVAIVGGSGSSFIDDAINQGADAFITSDISYHNFHKCKGILTLIDPGHYEMEQFVAIGLKKIIDSMTENTIMTVLSKIYTNPVSYYPDNGFKEKQINELLINYR